MRWNPIVDPEGAPEGEIESPAEFRNHASLVILAKDGMAMLQRHYPGWRWALQINEKGGVIHVFNYLLHDTWGYLIRNVEFEHEPSRKVFMRAGGEILRRFGQPAGAFNHARWKSAPRDPKGFLIPVIDDLLDARSKREQLRNKIAVALGNGTARTLVDSNGRTLVGL